MTGSAARGRWPGWTGWPPPAPGSPTPPVTRPPLTAALSALDAEFTALTGLPPRRRAGQNYAGRALCHEETARDVDLTVGGGLLDSLAPALDLPLRAARWLTAELATAYGDALRDLYDDLGGDGPVRLGDLWFVAQGPLFGPGDRPVDRVAAEFAARWERVLGLAGLPAGTSRVEFGAAELAPLVTSAFPAGRPLRLWSAGRVHSPDLQLFAESPEALAAGEFGAVLGELHAAYATFNAELFTHCHPDVDRLRRAYAADRGRDGCARSTRSTSPASAGGCPRPCTGRTTTGSRSPTRPARRATGSAPATRRSCPRWTACWWRPARTARAGRWSRCSPT